MLIGRKSDTADAAADLGIGITSDAFHTIGNKDFVKTELKA